MITSLINKNYVIKIIVFSQKNLDPNLLKEKQNNNVLYKLRAFFTTEVTEALRCTEKTLKSSKTKDLNLQDNNLLDLNL